MSDTAPPPGTSPDLQASRRRRVRNRLVRAFAPGPRGYGVRSVLEPLIRSHLAHHPDADIDVLQRAYDTAEHHHRDQTRRSGDPYITHPLAVAVILADLGMDTTTLVAALLHDTVEDTGYSLEQLIADFGHEVAHLVGLGHVNEPMELMFASNDGQTEFGPGDLTGLALLGSLPCR